MFIDHIRNFCIIAHIDHGKSTLADRLLEATGTVQTRDMRAQILDGMELERERGITIKAKAVRMNHTPSSGTPSVFNLIDTPGHVDFTYEVSRAMAACEGALLLVDASQGVEAQTLANAILAQESGLELIPVINKIDLPSADIEGVKKQIRDLGLTGDPLPVSAKEGKGVKEVLEAIALKIPAPQGDPESPLSALVFDSIFDSYRGVIIYVRLLDGALRAGMKVTFVATGASYEVEEVGHLRMKYVKADRLSAGEVGYVICGIKDIHQVKVGDTLTESARPTTRPHPGYREMKPFVFAGLYPMAQADYVTLRSSIEKLHLQDSAFFYQPETSVSLGFGFRCGFLGLLHLDIIKERLQREFKLDLLVTAPNVVYHVTTLGGQKMQIDNPAQFPPHGDIQSVEEPYVLATMVLPSEYVGAVMRLCQDRRGTFVDMRYMTLTRVVIKYEMPLAEIIIDFYDQLKSVSKGYASFDYEHVGHRPGDLVKLEILINNDVVDAFSSIVPEETSYQQGRKMAERLREIIPRQMFEVPIQAKVGSRVIARENIRSLRKDVLAKCYGGDITRKRKLLEKQKEGKKKMKQFGRVEIPQEAFLAVLKMDEPS